MRLKLRHLAAAGLVLLPACESTPTVIGGDRPGAPRDLEVEYRWELEGFSGAEPVGHPAVAVTWLPPQQWNDEPFRVYARRADGSSFFLVATVTSCTVDGCTYLDRNVAHGRTYEYFVATVNERTGEETESAYRDAVLVPAYSRPAAPVGGNAVALDGSLFLRWTDGGNGGNLSRYIVYLTRIDDQAYLYHMGETDATGFLDLRTQNGHRYGYRVAAVDTLGHVGALGAEFDGVPRPDFRGELVFAHAGAPTASGFRFVESEAIDPIVGGTGANAHWRFEADAAGWRVVPLNGVRVTEYPGRTTALVCGPGADDGCRAAEVAPASGYGTAAVEVQPEFSYVFQVPAAGGAVNYGVIRVQLLGTDQQGRDLMIFDWAYQLVPNEPRLDRQGG
jgi:hypothetical protein